MHERLRWLLRRQEPSRQTHPEEIQLDDSAKAALPKWYQEVILESFRTGQQIVEEKPKQK